MDLTGFKTFIAMAISGVAVPWLTSKGLTLTPDQIAWITGIAVAGVGVIMRLFTKTPPGQSVAATVVAAKTTNTLTAAKMVLMLLMVAPLLTLMGCAALTTAETAFSSACSSSTLAQLNTDLGVAQAGGAPIVAALGGNDASIATAVITDAADAVNAYANLCTVGQTALASAKLPLVQQKVAMAKAAVRAPPAKAASVARGTKLLSASQ